jgi:parallel beta-helix repeat protein
MNFWGKAKMQKNLIKIIIAFGIVILFIGTSIPLQGRSVFAEIQDSLPLPLSGNTLYVGGSGSGNYSIIQSAINSDWWPMFHHDLNHFGYSTSKAPEINATLWNFQTGDGIVSSSAVTDGKVYVGSMDHKVYCLNATTGAWIWEYATGNYVESSPAVVNGKVYVGSDDYKVYCLNASNGSYIWSYTTGGPVISSPAVVNGNVYVGSWDWKLYCLNASTGAWIWEYATGWFVESSPAVANGKVYVGSNDGKVYCLNASIGSYIWSYTTGNEVVSSPAVASGKVYIGSIDGKAYCFGEKQQSPSTIYVDNDADPSWYDATHVRTIQEGVNNASAGDTVFVFVGTYHENIVVDKSIVLIGEDRDTTIIDGGGSGSVVDVSSDSVNITGFTIRNSGNNSNNAGIYIQSNNNTIIENKISTNRYGIYLANVCFNTLRDNEITYNTKSGIMLHISFFTSICNNIVDNNSYGGIYVDSSSYITINGNIANYNFYGIYLFYSGFNIVSDNIAINNSRTGIEVIAQSNNVISNNTVSNSKDGIVVYNTNNNELRNNTVDNNSVNGIRLYYSHNNKLYYNTVTHTLGGGNLDDGGIFLHTSLNNQLVGNIINDNSQGILLWLNSNNNSISDNSLNNNYLGICLYTPINIECINNMVANNIITNTSSYGILVINDCFYNIFTGNIFCDNNYGLYFVKYFSTGPSNNLVYNNYFSNTNNVCDEGTNIWNITKTPGINIVGGPYLGGNYWNDYNGEDLDGDGIGDTNIPHYGDYLPLTLMCGNVNADGTINVCDVVYLINYLFGNDSEPVPKLCVGDVNGDGVVNSADVVYLINYLFIHGPAPGGCCGS